jgi:hypothetical protein
MQRAEKFLTGDVLCGFFLQPQFHLPLYRNMGNAFQLQAAPGRLGVVLLPHGPDDIVGVGVVSLDEIG